MKSDDDIYQSFESLWDDIRGGERFPSKRPLLAHYTSIVTLERIMANDEVWFSNPLFMNDMEELRFGINEGAQAFRRNESIKLACDTAERYHMLSNMFEDKLNLFSNEHAFDIYVFCLSEHDLKDADGLLSMWRGYGSNGNGAAIIFDTGQLDHNENSPMIISNVTYASSEDRRKWFDDKLNAFATLFRKHDIPVEKFYLPLHSLFERIKIYSIFTKHHGFSEEKEWRIVYLRERDRNHKMEHMLHYTVGRQGIEPKLKYKIEPIQGLTKDDLSLEKIVRQIILGPSVSSPLAILAMQRMLDKVGKHTLSQKLIASTTPFRSM